MFGDPEIHLPAVAGPPKALAAEAAAFTTPALTATDALIAALISKDIVDSAKEGMVHNTLDNSFKIEMDLTNINLLRD